MKAVIAALAVVILIGVAWVLAFLQIIPAQKMADQSAQAAQILVALHVAKAPKKHAARALLAAAIPAPTSAANQVLAAQEQALAAQKAQLDQEKAALDKEQAASAQPSGADPSDPATSPKVVSIYSTMKSDDIARIFAKLPDSAVVDNLNQMDDKLAGKVLAALPDDRAAKITVEMNHAQPSPAPQTSQL